MPLLFITEVQVCRWRWWRMSIYSYAPWRIMPQCSDEWGPDVLSKWARVSTILGFVSVGCDILWEEISPSIFLHCLPFPSALLSFHIWWGLNSGFTIPLWGLASTTVSSSCLHPPFLLSPIPLAPHQQSCPISSQILPICFLPFPQQTWGWHKCYEFWGPLSVSFSTLITSEFGISSITSLCSASSLRCVTGDSGHLSMRLMTPSSCTIPQSPLIYKLPPSLTKHAPFTPLPVWTSKAPGDGFGQGATSNHLREQMGNLRWKIHSPCTNPLPLSTFTPLSR